jgi:hypothetical protein
MPPINKLLSRLKRVHGRDGQWSALCPSHDDHSPSLSISEADDGRVLIKCHAGCSVEAIAAKVGLSLRDLFTDASQSHEKRAAARPGERRFEAFADAVDFVLKGVRRNTRSPYELSAQYGYRTTDGGELRVLRFEAEGKPKMIRQVSQRDGAWEAKRGQAKALPYRLEALGDDPIVLLVEGEKCVEALRAIGLAATTSVGGANAARKTDWTGLAGRTVVAFPDNDAAGQNYVRDVAAALGKGPLPTVDLPVGSGEDVVDYVEQRTRQGISQLAIRTELMDLARAELDTSTEPSVPSIADRAPFPIQLLPRVAGVFVQQMAAIMSSDPSTLALGALVAMSAAIGRAVKLRVTDEWHETCALWVAIVAPSGRGKSPAIRAAIKHIFDLDAAAKRRFDLAQAERAQEDRIRGTAASQRIDTTGVSRPLREKFVVTDLTIEALVLLLTENPRGLLFAPDELDAFFSSLERYRSGAGSDLPQWLAVHSGGAIRYERKTAGSLQVENSFVSMIGGIQPPVLARTFRGEGVSSGLAARFILYQPSPVPRVLRRKMDTTQTRAQFDALLDRLYSLAVRSDSNDPSHVVDFADDAGELAERFVGAWDRRFTSEADEALRAASAKLEAYALRIALILHVVEHAEKLSGSDVPMRAAALPPLSLRAMRSGIQIVQWAIGSAGRTYAEIRGRIDMSKLEARARSLAEHPAGVTAREWQRKRYRINAEQARAELEELVAAGLGERVDQSTARQGGRPTILYRLLPRPAAVPGPLESLSGDEDWQAELGCVDVDAPSPNGGEPPDGPSTGILR